jgi:ribosomal protein S12 methylthiotransferase accessory factor
MTWRAACYPASMSTQTSRIQVSFPGGKRVDAIVGDHVVRTDQSPAHGGAGAAAEPFELFLAALATCAGLYVLVFCQARDIPTERLSLVQDQVFENGRLLGIRLSIVVPADFPAKYLDAVRAAAASCRVKKTLADPPDVEVVVVSECANQVLSA